MRIFKRMVDLLEQAGIAPGCKPAIDRAPGRKVLRQLAPRTARAHHVENAVDDLAQQQTARAANALGGRQLRLDHAPFLIGHIALVAQTVAAIVLAGGWSPHGISRIGVSNRSGSRRLQSLNPFETAS